MKKTLFFLAVATVALASCSNDETVSQNTKTNQAKEIAFAPLAQNPTRVAADVAGAIEGTTFPTTLEMTVAAYDVTNSGEFFASPVEFAYNYEGGVSASSGKWGGKTAQYWPLSATQINFLAIANANADPTFNAISEGSKTVTIAQTDNYAYTAQNDLMYARGTGEVTFESNALTIPDDVSMTFQHAQSYLVFRLRAADAATAGKITIKDILVKDAYYSGTATVTHTNWNSFSSQDVSVSWASHAKHGESPYNYSVNTNNQTAWNSGAQALTQNYVELGHTIVLPHASAGFSTFTIQYWLDGKAYSFEYTPASTILTAGKKYIYDVTFKLHEIFVVPTVTDWVDGGTELVNIPPITYAENGSANINIPAAAGTYTLTVENLAAATYDVSAGTGTGSFITINSPTTSTAVTANGDLVIKFTVTSDTGKNQPIELKVGGTTKFTITVTQS